MSDWGSDTPPSSPVAPRGKRYIPFGGFCFTEGGIAPDLSAVEAEEFRHAPIAPYTEGSA